MNKTLPVRLQGKVVKGFGRGSAELGTPTANFEDDVVKSLPSDLPNGIYFGWAQVDFSSVYPMVMSLGWNPFYKNEKRTAETHIMHTFENNFYGSLLKVIVVGFIRPEKDFTSKEELVAAIRSDIAEASDQLQKAVCSEYQTDHFFSNLTNDVTQVISSSKLLDATTKNEDILSSIATRM